MGLKALRKALKNKVVDEFETGTVIRWLASDRYTYVAVKTPVGWYTSAKVYNDFVPQVVDFDELTEILSRSETSNIEVAESWTPVV